MQTEFAFSHCTKKCAVSGRSLEPEEQYYSVVLSDGEEYNRQDIAATHWQGPPENSVGWWRSQMPPAVAKTRKSASAESLLEALTTLLEQPEKEALAYMLALLLCRRRILTDQQSIHDSVDENVWRVSSFDGRVWSVPIVTPKAEQAELLHNELDSLLYVVC